MNGNISDYNSKRFHKFKKKINRCRSLLDVRSVYNYEKEYRNNSALISISHKKSNVYNDLKSE